MDEFCCLFCGDPLEDCLDDDDLVECGSCGRHFEIIEINRNRKACQTLLEVMPPQ